MKALIMKRVFDFCAVITMLLGVIVVLKLLFRDHFDNAYVILTYVGLLFYLLLFGKTNSYALYPYSRRKLLGFHLIESILILTFQFVSFAVVLELSAFLDQKPIWEYTFRGLALVSLLVGYLRLVNPLGSIEMRAMTAVSNSRSVSPTQLKQSIFKPKLLLSIALILAFWIVRDPWMYGAFLIWGFLLIPAIGMTRLGTPKSTLKSIYRIVNVAAAFVFIAVTLLSYYLVETAMPNRTTTQLALRYIGRLPVSVSNARAYELFNTSASEPSTALFKILQAKDFQLSDEQWAAKVNWCTVSSCLAVADKIGPDGKSAHAKLSNFILLMNRSKPWVDENGKLEFKGIGLVNDLREVWYRELAPSDEVNKWLQGPETIPKVLAALALSRIGYTAEQERLLNEMADSDNTIVKAAALESIGQNRKRFGTVNKSK